MRRERNKMINHEQERKLKERVKASYEAYIQPLKEKSVLDLIEVASERASRPALEQGVTMC